MASTSSGVLFAGVGAAGLQFIGPFNASLGVFPGSGAALNGWLYKTSVAGTVDGVVFDVGDSLIASTANASATTYAGNWTKIDATESVSSVFGRTGNVVAAADDLSDVDTTTTAPTNGQTLVWNSTLSQWRPGAAGASTLDALTDVDTTTVAPVTNDILKFNGTLWSPAALGASGFAGIVANVTARLALPDTPGQHAFQSDGGKRGKGAWFAQIRTPVTSNANWIMLAERTTPSDWSDVSLIDWSSTEMTWDATN